jgi:uncharacterized membrane protein YuzA (DUF378 family)
MILLKSNILFYVAGASTLIAGVLHLAIVPMFFNKMPANVTVFFIVSGLAQLFWLIPVIKRWSNIWYYIGIGGTVILIILWIIAVPARGLAVSELEVVIEFFQVVFIVLCTIIVKNTAMTTLSKKNF